MTSITTNIMNKSKAQIILDLVLSLNKGNSGYVDDRVSCAIEQYDTLVRKGIIEDT